MSFALTVRVSGPVEPAFDADDTLVRLGDDHELFGELVESFRRDAAKGLREIRRSVSEGDARSMVRAAHTLRGVVSLFAAAPAIRAIDAIERAGHEHSTDVAPLLTTLEGALSELDQALSQYRERVSSS